MSEQNPVFLLKNDVEEILKGIYSVVLYDYFSERHETGLDHATWISLYDIGFPRGDFAEILRFGVTVDEASRLYDKLTEMVDYDDLETSRHEKWCLDRYNDYCHALAQDSLSLDQAFEVATRPAGRPYESALSDVASLDDGIDDAIDDDWYNPVYDTSPSMPSSGNRYYGSCHDGGGSAGIY